jgi:hypothetical protein
MTYTIEQTITAALWSLRVRHHKGVWSVKYGSSWLLCSPAMVARLDQLQAEGALTIAPDGFAEPQEQT